MASTAWRAPVTLGSGTSVPVIAYAPNGDAFGAPMEAPFYPGSPRVEVSGGVFMTDQSLDRHYPKSSDTDTLVAYRAFGRHQLLVQVGRGSRFANLCHFFRRRKIRSWRRADFVKQCFRRQV